MERICPSCAYVTDRPGRACPVCGTKPMLLRSEHEAWLYRRSQIAAVTKGAPKGRPQRTGTIDSFDDEDTKRIKIGWPSLDYFFGGSDGGIEEGAVFRLTGAPGLGKCVTGDTLVTCADGEKRPITAFANEAFSVATLDTSLGRMGTAAVSAFIPQGRHPVVRVCTDGSKAVRCTLSHPFCTPYGWVPASELRMGSSVLTSSDGVTRWEKIASLEPYGEEDVYDISVPRFENFVANDIVVHNSTLLLQLTAATGAMYLCSEESGGRVAKRARRLGLKGLDKAHLVIGASMERAKREIERVRPKVMIVDSLQTFQYIPEELEDDMDAVDFKAQENHDEAVMIALDFIKIAQKTKSAVVLINHLTKEGQAAGKIKIDYLIDGNFEIKGDPTSHVRMLTATKNRTAGTTSTAVFWMTNRGLIDAPKGDQAEALERMIAEGLIDPPTHDEKTEEQEAADKKTFDAFERHEDKGPMEKPTQSRRRRGKT